MVEDALGDSSSKQTWVKWYEPDMYIGMTHYSLILFVFLLTNLFI